MSLITDPDILDNMAATFRLMAVNKRGFIANERAQKNHHHDEGWKARDLGYVQHLEMGADDATERAKLYRERQGRAA